MVFTSPAQGSAFYLETTGGLSKVLSGSGFYPGLSGGTSYGLGLQGSLMYQWGYENAFWALDFGLHSRFSSTSNTNPPGSYTLWSVYPALRLQASRLFVGGGFTTLNWRRVSDIQGYENFEAVRSSTSIFGEAGILFPITPMFTIGGTVGYTLAKASGGSANILDVGFLLRFYFAPLGDKRKSLEWDGWRYPFGYYEGN